MLLKLTFSFKVQHPCGRVTWWRYTQSLCHLSVPHLDDVDAIAVSIIKETVAQLTDLKHDLTKIEKIQPFPTNETSIQTLDHSSGLLLCVVFLPKRRPGNNKNHGGLVGKVLWLMRRYRVPQWFSAKFSRSMMGFLIPRIFWPAISWVCVNVAFGGEVGWDPGTLKFPMISLKIQGTALPLASFSISPFTISHTSKVPGVTRNLAKGWAIIYIYILIIILKNQHGTEHLDTFRGF